MKRLTSAELRMRIAVPVMAAALGISAFASKEHIPYILGITSKASAALYTVTMRTMHIPYKPMLYRRKRTSRIYIHTIHTL